MKIALSALTLLVGACATTDGVVPLADGTYIVTGQANFGPNKAIEARKAALSEATNTCAALDRDLVVITLDNSGDVGRAAGPLALYGETRLTFKCIARRPEWPGSQIRQ